MHQAEDERDDQSPVVDFSGEKIFDADERDGCSDDGLDDLRRQADVTQRCERERDGVGCGERGDLPEHGLDARREQKQSKHEETVIRAFGNDVRVAQDDILPRDFEEVGGVIANKIDLR